MSIKGWCQILSIRNLQQSSSGYWVRCRVSIIVLVLLFMLWQGTCVHGYVCTSSHLCVPACCNKYVTCMSLKCHLPSCSIIIPHCTAFCRISSQTVLVSLQSKGKDQRWLCIFKRQQYSYHLVNSFLYSSWIALLQTAHVHMWVLWCVL